MLHEQQKEIDTIKGRQITLNLSDADVKRISEKAGAAGLSISQLLENFIGDLVGGTYSNGSDERMYAEQWFQRCWFSWMNSSFVGWLIDMGEDVEYVVENWNYYQQELKRYADNQDECDAEELELWKKDIDELKQEIDEIYTEFIGENKADKFDFAEEMEKVLKYWAEYQRMLGGKNE